MAERSVTGEDPRGAVITMRNPRNPSEEIQVREGSIDATLLADSGWIPSTEVESFTNEQGRLMRQIGPTVQVQKDGRWIDADTFYGRSSSDTPDMLSVSGGNRRPPPNDPIVSLSRGVDFEESLDTVLNDPQKIRESTPSNLKALGYEYVDPSLVPNFDPIEAGIGLWDAGGKVLLNRTPVVGQSLQALSAGSFAEANEKSKLMHARVINIVRKLSSVAEVRPGIWDQMLALREAAQSGIFQTEERAVQQFEAMAVEARRMIGFMNDIIEDPTSHVNDIREAKSALRSSEQILALTQNMLFAHELYSTSIPIGNKNLKIGNLDRNDLDNLLSYMGSAYDQTGSLPEGITPRKLALLSFYEKNIVGQGDR